MEIFLSDPAFLLYLKGWRRFKRDSATLRLLAANPLVLEFPPHLIRAIMEDEGARRILLERQDLDWSNPRLAPYAIYKLPLRSRRRLADNISLRPQDVRRLVKDHEPEVRQSLAANPRLNQFPQDVLQALIDDASTWPLVFARPDLDWSNPLFAPYVPLRDPAGAAEDPNITNYPLAAQKIASAQSEEIRARLASNPAIRALPDILKQMARDQSLVVRLALAKSDALQGARDVIEEMVQSEKESHVLAGLAQNPALIRFPHLIRELAKKPAARRAIPLNPAIDKHTPLAFEIARQWEANDRARLASNPSLLRVPYIIKILANDQDKRVRRALAKNPYFFQMPYEIQRKLRDDPDVWPAIFSRGDVDWSSELYAPYIIVAGTRRDRLLAARSPDIARFPSPAQLLAHARDPYIRILIASNPDVIRMYPALTRKLAGDTRYIQRALAKNPALAEYPEIVQDFYNQSDYFVRLNLARNPRLVDFPHFFRGLAADPAPRVRRAIANHPGIAAYPDVAMSLALDAYPSVRSALARNNQIRFLPDLINILVQDSAWMVRAALAGNPAIIHFPLAVHILAYDIDPLVRRALKRVVGSGVVWEDREGKKKVALVKKEYFKQDLFFDLSDEF